MNVIFVPPKSDTVKNGIIYVTIYYKGSTDGVGIEITKYNDEYFHVVIEDIYNKNGHWDSLPFSGGGSNYICDQIIGVIDCIKYDLRHSYFKSSSNWRREFLNYNKNK